MCLQKNPFPQGLAKMNVKIQRAWNNGKMNGNLFLKTLIIQYSFFPLFHIHLDFDIYLFHMKGDNHG